MPPQARCTPRFRRLSPIFLLAMLLLCFGPGSTQDRAALLVPPRSPEQTTPTYTYQIINLYPHDRGAFTQGLLYADDILYEGTGLWGRSSLRKVELESGTVLQIHELDSDYFGEGLALYEDKLYQLTWQSGIAFVYDKDTFTQTGTFTYSTQGWGLTHDNQQLIMSDGSAVLYFRDPRNFEVLDQISVHDENGTVTRLNELEFIDGQVLANVWQTNRIARIDSQTGQVSAWLDMRGLLSPEDYAQSVDVLNGIAYDTTGERLFVTGKLWPWIFEIELVPMSANDPWNQVNQDGFGQPANRAITALETHRGSLYAGTRNQASGAQIWRSDDGLKWTAILTSGLGVSTTTTIADLASFDGHLYASAGAELWRSSNGEDWSRATNPGFGDGSNQEIASLAVFSGSLYAGTHNTVSGTQIWHSHNGLDWLPDNSPGSPDDTTIGAWAVFSNSLFGGTANHADGAQLWQSNGLSWTSVMTKGFGLTDNVAIASLGVFESHLYALTENATGLQIWRSPDGLTWTQVLSGGLKHRGNNPSGSMIVYDKQLYLVSENAASGAQVWRTADGIHWEQVAFAGWGDVTNLGPGNNHSLALFHGGLYVGAAKTSAGGEVWHYGTYILGLPQVIRP